METDLSILHTCKHAHKSYFRQSRLKCKTRRWEIKWTSVPAISSACCQTSALCVQEPLRAAWWTAKRQSYRRPPGRVQDAGGRSPTASCSSPWNATGTLAASNALAAKPSWGTLAPPATAKGAWFCVGATTSGERKEEVGGRRRRRRWSCWF